MIDFSKYTLTELQAMSAVLDDLTYRMSICDTMKAHMLPYHYYKEVTCAVAAAIDQQARDYAAAEAEKVQLSSMYGTMAAAEATAPDMFGWVGDALDDLCAAGEVIGNDR